MKKYLMILSGISAIGIGTIVNVINIENNPSNANLAIKTQVIKQTLDLSKYDVADGSTQSFKLDNLLNLIKEINQEHKENNKKLTFNRFPRWNLISDNGTIFAVGWMFLAQKQLENLVNSDNVQFENVLMSITGSEQLIKVSLNYQISSISQTLELIQIQQENIPLKQEQMKTGVEISYY